MLARATLTDYSDNSRIIMELAVAVLTQFITGTGFSSQTAVVTFMNALIQRYGFAAMVLTAQLFMSITGLQPVAAAHLLPKVGLSTSAGQVALKKAVAFAAKAAAAGATATAVKVLADRFSVNQKKLQAKMMEESAKKHGKKFARVPTGATTCEWCTMLASRGFVYASEKSAGGGLYHGTEMDAYHSFCDCQIVVSDDDSVEGYDPSIYYDEYIRADDIVRPGMWDRWQSLSQEEQDYFGSYSEFYTKSVVAQMRALRGGHWDGEPVVPNIKLAHNFSFEKEEIDSSHRKSKEPKADDSWYRQTMEKLSEEHRAKGLL